MVYELDTNPKISAKEKIKQPIRSGCCLLLLQRIKISGIWNNKW